MSARTVKIHYTADGSTTACGQKVTHIMRTTGHRAGFDLIGPEDGQCAKCARGLHADDVNTLDERTKDAHSSERYARWSTVCAFLLDRGYTMAEAEEVLRSKWMRYAADQATSRKRRGNGVASVRDLETWLTKSFKGNLVAEVREVHEMMLGVRNAFAVPSIRRDAPEAVVAKSK